MEELKKDLTIYYRKKDGYLCDRYPLDIFSKDLSDEEKGSYTCLNEEEYGQTFSVEYGYTWGVIDNKLQVIPNAELQATDEYQRYISNCKYGTALRYLSDTDFIVAKINEAATVNDDLEEVAALKAQYAEQIAKRKEYRKLINELEEKYPDLKK